METEEDKEQKGKGGKSKEENGEEDAEEDRDEDEDDEEEDEDDEEEHKNNKVMKDSNEIDEKSSSKFLSLQIY